MMSDSGGVPDGEVIERYNVGDLEVTVAEKDKEVIYYVNEPRIGKDELERSRTIIENFYSKASVSHKSTREALEGELGRLSKSGQYHTRKTISPYGRLYPLVLDPNILEVNVISSEKPVFVRHRHFLEQPYVKTNIRFESRKEADDCLGRLKNRISPYTSVNLCEGLVDEDFYGRVIIQRHPYESLCFLKRRLSLPSTATWLIEDRTLSPQEKAYLWTLIETKTTIAVVGGARENRRLLLNGMIAMIPQRSKIMAVEKTPTSIQLHEYFFRLFVSEESGLGCRTALDVAEKLDIEYAVMDADDVGEETELPVDRICFIYSCQAPLKTSGGVQVCVVLPNSLTEGSIRYVEEVGGEQVQISLSPSDTPRQIFEKSRILQVWAKTNCYSREKVVESITLKSNLVMYISGDGFRG